MSDFAKDTNVPTNDCISRQAAIDAVRSYYDECDESDKSIEERIEALPPARLDLDEWCTDCKEYDSEKHSCPRFNHVIRKAMERKKGQWIHDGYDFPHGNDWIHCSECGKRGINVPADLTNYCPHCGADMRG